MENSCEKRACGWLILIVVIAGFAALYHLIDSRMPAAVASAEGKCGSSKEISLNDYGDVLSISQDGSILRVVLGKEGDGVYSAISIDTCENKVLNKVIVNTK